ncbi:MAG: protein BatD, partial [Candidatus Eisenbacteria bacterium]|nr:protein BatD [Candidatus Eisenbacteria bacterium]
MTRTGSFAALVALALTGLMPAVAPAADIEVAATVDRTVASVNDRIVLTVTVTGTMRQVPTPKLPDLSDSFVVQSAGSSTNFSMVNGQVTSSRSWSYSLLPRSVGSFTIGAAEVEFAGSVYRTDPIAVEVVEGRAPAAAVPGERQSSGVQSGGRDVFITTSVDRKRAYVDEQITLSFKFYRRIALWEQPRYTPPELSGFWSEDLPPQEESYESVGGVRYQVTEIRTALFPTAPGRATVGPATLVYSEGGGGFGFFATPGRRRQLTTEPIAIEVVPLPQEGRPADFGGAVGSYRITASIEPASVPAHQPATLKVRISGTGNVRKLTAPRLPELPDFKVYESSTTSDPSRTGGAMGGTKIYEYVLVPQTPGRKTVPAIRLPHFSPSSGEYRVADTGDLTLEVTEAVAGAEEARPPTAGIARLGTDIRYIREPGGTLTPAAEPVYARPWFVLLQLAPLVALGGTWAGKRRRDRLVQDDRLARLVGAKGRARRGLRRAREAAGDRGEACASVARVVTDFIGDRLGVPARGMTLPELATALREAGADDALVGTVRGLLERCDLGRFAGGAAEVEGGRLVD